MREQVRRVPDLVRRSARIGAGTRLDAGDGVGDGANDASGGVDHDADNHADNDAGNDAGAVVTEAVRRCVARIIENDPLVRSTAANADSPAAATDLTGPGGDTAVHQMRVGCRRLRSDLRTFAPLVDQAWSNGLRTELSWLAGLLGAARDAEVLRIRLVGASAPLDGQALDRQALDKWALDKWALRRFDERLARRQSDALARLDVAMRSDRYLDLLVALTTAAHSPRLTEAAEIAARVVLPGVVARPWQRLVSGGRGVPGAADLTADSPDALWHGVRINAKRARYAVEAVAGALDERAARLGRRLAAVQELLGQHQDAAVAGRTWLELGASAHQEAGREADQEVAMADRGRPAFGAEDAELAITAGRLFERERGRICRLRKQWPQRWQRCDRRELTGWMR